MAQKHRYSKKEHRQVEHIAESESARGVSPAQAETSYENGKFAPQQIET